jgi:hypothetical protein
MHIFSELIRVVEELNSHICSLDFVVHLWIKIGQNENGWCRSSRVFTSVYSNFALQMSIIAMLTTVEQATSRIRCNTRAGQSIAGYIVQ